MVKKCPECLGVGHVKQSMMDDSIKEFSSSVEHDSSPVSKGVLKVDKRSKGYRNGRRKTDNLYA